MKKEIVIGWCLIPPYIIASNLSANEKLVYGRIMGLTGKRGFCDASDFWLGEQLQLDEHTVANIISSLKKQGLLTTEVKRDTGHKVLKRRIFLDNSFLKKGINNKHSFLNAGALIPAIGKSSGMIDSRDKENATHDLASQSVDISVDTSGVKLENKNRKQGTDLLTPHTKIRKEKEKKKIFSYQGSGFKPASQKNIYEKKQRTIARGEGIV